MDDSVPSYSDPGRAITTDVEQGRSLEPHGKDLVAHGKGRPFGEEGLVTHGNGRPFDDEGTWINVVQRFKRDSAK
jgi:hypothetical protein